MAESVTVVGIQFQTGGDAQVAKAFKRLGREAGVLKKWVIAIKSGLAYRKFTGLSIMELFVKTMSMNMMMTFLKGDV